VVEARGVAGSITQDRAGGRACAAAVGFLAVLAAPPAAGAEICRERLVPPSSSQGDQFGCSVAGDAGLLAVGANLADVGGVRDAGAVVLFDATDNRPIATLTAPTPQAEAEFGFAIAVDRDFVAVGAPREDVEAARDIGAVYVFQRLPNGAFSAATTLTAADAAPDARFGQVLALRGGLLVVGAPFDSNSGRGTRAGAVYVFGREHDGRWVRRAKLTGARTHPFDGFGFAVALSADASTLVAGAPFYDGPAGDEQGAVHRFRRADAAGAVWNEEPEVTAGAAAAAGEQFGVAVALDGDRRAVGARRRKVNGHANAGAVVVLQRTASGWEREALLGADRPEAGALLGGAVSLAGPRLAAGALGQDGERGVVYLFERSEAGAWGLVENRNAPQAAPFDRFGQALAIVEGALLVGAYLADPDERRDAGAAFHCLLGPAVIEPSITKVRENAAAEVLPGQTLTYRVKVSHAPSGTEVCERPVKGLANLEWCPGETCTDFQPGLLSDTLAPGGDAVYRVRGTVPASACGSVINQACAKVPGDSPACGEKRCAPAEDRLPGADVAVVEATPDRSTGRPGDVVIYSLRVKNRGRRAAPGVQMSAEVSGGLVETAWCRGAGCTPTDSKPPAPFDLPPDDGDTVMYKGELACTARTVVTVRFCAQPAPAACDSADDCAPVQVVCDPGLPPPPPTLAVTLTPTTPCPPASPVTGASISGDPVPSGVAGRTVCYRAQVKNMGLGTAHGTFLTIKSGRLDLVKATSSCDDGAGPFWLGRLIGGQGCDIDVQLAIPCAHPEEEVSIEATVGAANADPASDTEALVVRIEADYGVAFSGPAMAFAGDPILYGLAVTNAGPSCPKVVVSADLAPELAGVRWCEGGGCSPARSCPLRAEASPLPGETTVFRIEGRTSPLFTGSVTSHASLGPAPGVFNPGNDRAEITTKIVPPPGMHGFCTGWPHAAHEGDLLSLTFVLINGGPFDQVNRPAPEFTVDFPAGLILGSVTASQGTAATGLHALTWDGALPGGCPPEAPEACRVEITVKVTVAAGTAGKTFCVQGVVCWDADGDGVADTFTPTDDLEAPGESDACCIHVLEPGEQSLEEIPAAGPAGLALLALLIGFAAVRVLLTGRA
jgi:hypothetical protein